MFTLTYKIIFIHFPLIKKLNFYIFHIYFEKMFLVKIKRLDN